MNVTEPPKLLVSQRQMGLLQKTLNDIRDALEHLSVYAEVAADDLFSALRSLTALTSGDVEEDFYTRSFPIFASGSNSISSGFLLPFYASSLIVPFYFSFAGTCAHRKSKQIF